MKNVNGNYVFTYAEGIRKVMDCVMHSQFKDYIIHSIELGQYAGKGQNLQEALYVIRMSEGFDKPIEEHWFDVWADKEDGKFYGCRCDNYVEAYSKEG